MKSFGNGKLARTTGIATVPQWSQIAKGTLFATLEDETGIINVITWSALLEISAREMLNASPMTVYGYSAEGEGEALANHVVDHFLMLVFM